MSEVDFDSDQQILMSVTGAGTAAQAAGATLQIELPDGHVLGFTQHPFAGKTGEELQQELDSVRATWKMRQAMHESSGKKAARMRALETPLAERDNQDAPIPMDDGELLLSANTRPEKRRIVVPSAVERDIERRPVRGAEPEQVDESPLASVERQLATARKRLAVAEKDLDDAQRRYDKAQSAFAKWQRAHDAIDTGDDDDEA